MANQHKTNGSWGRPREFIGFFAILGVIGVAAAFHWHVLALDLAFTFAWLAFLVVGSVVLLWQGWRHRGEPGGARLGQLAVLRRSWQKWVLGESDERSKK